CERSSRRRLVRADTKTQTPADAAFRPIEKLFHRGNPIAHFFCIPRLATFNALSAWAYDGVASDRRRPQYAPRSLHHDVQVRANEESGVVRSSNSGCVAGRLQLRAGADQSAPERELRKQLRRLVS